MNEEEISFVGVGIGLFDVKVVLYVLGLFLFIHGIFKEKRKNKKERVKYV